jgi:hypothetical protein
VVLNCGSKTIGVMLVAKWLINMNYILSLSFSRTVI